MWFQCRDEFFWDGACVYLAFSSHILPAKYSHDAELASDAAHACDKGNGALKLGSL
jgi:hypothetical protein